MGKRTLGKSTATPPYFEPAPASPPLPETEEGKRDMKRLAPFVISGGRNTERYYFIHVSHLTSYKFNVRPEYFGDESNYTEVFPKRIRDILKHNADARIFCVFDWDTIYGKEPALKKHQAFLAAFKTEVTNGNVVLCSSMPCIEYWFLLHFTNHKGLLKSYSAISGLLAPFLKPCFPDPSKNLKKLLKSEKHLKDPAWVEKLCADGKLERAILWAEENINRANEEGSLDRQSYTYIYKLFKDYTEG